MATPDPPDRTLLGIFALPVGTAWADLTDDEIDAWVSHVVAAINHRLAEVARGE